MSRTRNLTQEQARLLTTVYDDAKEEMESQLFTSYPILKMISQNSTGSYMRPQKSLEEEIMEIKLQQGVFLKRESAFQIQESATEEQVLQMIRKKGPKQMKATNYTRKLCNAHKWDYRHFLRRWKKYAKFFFRDNKELELICRSLMNQVGTRKTTTNDIVKLFANETDQRLIQMSYLNCQILSTMLQQKMTELLFDSKKLGNKKTFYLHAFNKYMRIQSISLAGRLQAR